MYVFCGLIDYWWVKYSNLSSLSIGSRQKIILQTNQTVIMNSLSTKPHSPNYTIGVFNYLIFHKKKCFAVSTPRKTEIPNFQNSTFAKHLLSLDKHLGKLSKEKWYSSLAYREANSCVMLESIFGIVTGIDMIIVIKIFRKLQELFLCISYTQATTE